jgi:hypothetical protein
MREIFVGVALAALAALMVPALAAGHGDMNKVAQQHYSGQAN